MPELNTFLKAVKQYFGEDRPVTVPEFKDLTTQDKVELSKMLNDAGFTHAPYVPQAPKAE